MRQVIPARTNFRVGSKLDLHSWPAAMLASDLPVLGHQKPFLFCSEYCQRHGISSLCKACLDGYTDVRVRELVSSFSLNSRISTSRDGHQNLKSLLIDLNQMHLIGLVERTILVFE